MDLAFPPEIRRRTDKNAMFVELINGSTVQLLGSDNYNALMGTNYVGIVFSEWALSDPESWAYLRPNPDRKPRVGAVHFHAARKESCAPHV